MRILLISLTFLLLSCGSSSGSKDEPSPTPTPTPTPPPLETQLHIVPQPTTVETENSTVTFGLSANLQADALNKTSKNALENLTADLNIQHDVSADYRIELLLITDTTLGTEGYKLDIERDIVITAQTDAGLFYGVQTLRQLLPATAESAYELPQVQIIDTPNYVWRGSMIDVARNFFTIEYLKKHIERMALFKLNKLHLHLSDDQGWRVEIKAYPLLTEIGGSTKAGGGPGGFYTQEELIDLVEFAAQYNVEIIPELDMPGHVQAAIASYNELACENVTNLSLYTGLEVGFSALCLSKPDVIYPFVEQVLTELASIFPSQYLHIGGDEIKDPLYAEFIEKANVIINDLDRTMIGWEEASAGDITHDSLIQFWNDNYDIQSIIDRQIGMILSPCSYTYIDHGNYNNQPDTYKWCRAQGVPLERIYSFSPENFALAVGVEAPMWSELVTSEAAADNRMWPRLAAAAELSWSIKANRNYSQFVMRLSALKPQLDHLGIQYYAEPQLGW